ncbi:glutamate dehydrogenase, putative [Leishmania panamensis]|uniref:Glutamate dehydrogenase n=2 Tax=Leishmania guyanensis species complex TaxID=38579 RepID=A0A088RV80_LEIPA|nr:glutamate dehydrogenase, putative [Leishmania panamensis]AIN99938.1 glutamate dehydrogenase, putative [Leishmania panamensis]CCM17139.1 glutamate dehydrogenase, putative [Leishmania guyanensis]
MSSFNLQYTSVNDFIEKCVLSRDPHQPEFTQAVREVMTSLWPFLQKNPKYAKDGLLERLVEPERLIQFRVPWVDDKGVTHVNRAFRVQFNSSIGPYKGGMRFHPSVNLSILKFLAFEQTFKNSLTTLPMGGGKGGSDFDPKGKSDLEVMRFCQSLVTELYRHIGADTDVPAGDIGVGSREVGYMNGMYWKLRNTNECTFTGKGLSYQGSEIRPEATGYGLVYFAQAMLERVNDSLNGKTVLVSGSGNVAQYTIMKCIELNARVVTASDSKGYIHDPCGFDKEKLAKLMRVKNECRGTLEEYAKEVGVSYVPGKRPWCVKADIALPCATQNEIEAADAKTMVANGVKLVAEGANMPTTEEATEVLQKAGVMFAPGKASNAGGVAISGLEMSQNAARLAWCAEEVDSRLHDIMSSIHASCVKYGEQDGKVNYVNGANIAGFVKVADAMLALGIV